MTTFAVVAAAMGAELRGAVERARRAGFGGVVIDVFPAGGAGPAAVDLTTLSQSGRRELRHVCESAAVPIVALQCELGARALARSAETDRALARARVAIETAAGLGAGMVCVDLGSLPAAPPPPASRTAVSDAMAGLILLPTPAETKQFAERPSATEQAGPADEAFVSRTRAVMDELARAADRTGVRVAFGSTLASPHSLAAAVRAIDTPLFGIDFDPAAMIASGMSMEAAFDLMGSRISHVRARDAVAGEGHRSKPAIVGSGDVNWREMMTLLAEADYGGAITLSPIDLPDPAGAAISGLAMLVGSC